VLVTPPAIDGIYCVDVLKTDTTHMLPGRPGSAYGCTVANGLPGRYDYGQAVVAFTPVSRNTTADVSTAGNVGVGKECAAGTPSGTICAAGVMIAPAAISTFPKAGPANKGEVRIASNGANATDCSIGGGGAQVTCISDGTTYVPLTGSDRMVNQAVADQRKVRCSLSGNAIFSEPEQTASYKKVVVYLDHCSGTAIYTYPTAFTHVPQLLSQSLTAREFPSISSTSLTVNSNDATGLADLDGF
jgi:hypothetical protein